MVYGLAWLVLMAYLQFVQSFIQHVIGGRINFATSPHKPIRSRKVCADV